MFSFHVIVGCSFFAFPFQPFHTLKSCWLHSASPVPLWHVLFLWERDGTKQTRCRQYIVVCICIKKLIDGAGLLKCELSGNRLLGKVDDGFQSLTTHSVQQVYCLQECGFKESNDIIFLWKGSFVCTFITLPFSVNGSTFMKHCVAPPPLSFILFYVFSFFLFIDNHYLCTRLWGSWS